MCSAIKLQDTLTRFNKAMVQILWVIIQGDAEQSFEKKHLFLYQFTFAFLLITNFLGFI